MSLRKAHEVGDLEAIDATMESLNKAWEAASQDIYNAQQSASAEGGPSDSSEGPSEGGDEAKDVEDVDFEEVK